VKYLYPGVILRRTVCDDIDWLFVNQSRSHHQSQALALMMTSNQVVKTLVNVITNSHKFLGTTLTQTIILHQLIIYELSIWWKSRPGSVLILLGFRGMNLCSHSVRFLTSFNCYLQESLPKTAGIRSQGTV